MWGNGVLLHLIEKVKQRDVKWPSMIIIAYWCKLQIVGMRMKLLMQKWRE